jgi:tripartite-type tricarboxylate transporter receptor subunit TctC
MALSLVPRPRRWLALAAAAACLLPALSAMAEGAYPSRTITLINPYAAGGPADTLARTLARQLQARLKQTVIVDSKAGGGGAIAKGTPEVVELLGNLNLLDK